MTRFAASGPLRGTLRPPPDKSISHRAALIGAMGEGTTAIESCLDAADTRATLGAIQVIGAEVEELGPSSGAGGNELRVRGIGLRGPGGRFAEGAEPVALEVSNAGTLLRILPGWLAGQGRGAWTLDGDESIRRRPVDRVAEPLRMMGARVECRNGRLPPLRVEGSALHGVSYQLPVASAQLKSCVLIAGLLADGETQVTEAAVTRDHTERMLAAAGAEVEVTELRAAAAVHSGPVRRIAVRPAERLAPERISVPGDFSSAAFPLVAAALVPRSRVRLEQVGLNPTRIGLLGTLHRMGAAVEVEEDHSRGGPEPRGAIVARHGPLAATRVHGDEVPLAIDELPLVALVGCFAEGRTVVSGAGELRHKESDRIDGTAAGLRALGVRVDVDGHDLRIHGGTALVGAPTDSLDDHRLAMTFAVAGLLARGETTVHRPGSAAVSYPGFFADLERVGA